MLFYTCYLSDLQRKHLSQILHLKVVVFFWFYFISINICFDFNFPRQKEMTFNINFHIIILEPIKKDCWWLFFDNFFVVLLSIVRSWVICIICNFIFVKKLMVQMLKLKGLQIESLSKYCIHYLFLFFVNDLRDNYR